MSLKDSFRFFLQSWLDQLNTVVAQLDCVPLDLVHETEQQGLVSVFMEHQEALFSARIELVSCDPFLGVHFPWMNSLGRALQWYGGWRPVAAFGLARGCRVILADQEAVLQAMRVATKVEEVAVEREKRHIELALISGFVKGKSIESMESSLKATMKKVALAADIVRMEAVKRITSILAPAKAVVYLAELGRMQADFYHEVPA